MRGSVGFLRLTACLIDHEGEERRQELQDLQQALGIRFADPDHNPLQQKVQTRHDFLPGTRQLAQNQVACLHVLLEVFCKQCSPTPLKQSVSYLPGILRPLLSPQLTGEP